MYQFKKHVQMLLLQMVFAVAGTVMQHHCSSLSLLSRFVTQYNSICCDMWQHVMQQECMYVTATGGSAGVCQQQQCCWDILRLRTGMRQVQVLQFRNLEC
jgi:hypothetical protein